MLTSTMSTIELCTISTLFGIFLKTNKPKISWDRPELHSPCTEQSQERSLQPICQHWSTQPDAVTLRDKNVSLPGSTGLIVSCWWDAFSAQLPSPLFNISFIRPVTTSTLPFQQIKHVLKTQTSICSQFKSGCLEHSHCQVKWNREVYINAMSTKNTNKLEFDRRINIWSCL